CSLGRPGASAVLASQDAEDFAAGQAGAPGNLAVAEALSLQGFENEARTLGRVAAEHQSVTPVARAVRSPPERRSRFGRPGTSSGLGRRHSGRFPDARLADGR